MKFTSKRLLSILLCLAMLATLSVAAFAEGDTYVVAGVEALCGSNWSADDAANAMTLQGDVYVKTYTNVAEGSYQFKVVQNGNWDTSWGKDGNNVEFAVGTACDVTITFNPADGSITVTGSGIVKATLDVTAMYAVGNGSVDATGAWLNGADWKQDEAANEMTKVGDAKWSITYSNVPAGTAYEVKFAANGSWDHSWGGSYTESGVAADAYYNGSNIAVSVSEASNVTLTIDLTNYDHDAKTGAVFTVTVAAVTVDEPETTEPETTEPETTEPETTEPETTEPETTEPETTEPETTEPETTEPEATEPEEPTEPEATEPVELSIYRVTGNTDWLGNWDAGHEAGRMVEVSEGVYEITFANVAAGEYQFKVTNGTWDQNWGGDGPDGNYVLNVETAGDITITFDLASGAITVKGNVANPDTGDAGVIGLVVAMALAATGMAVVCSKKKEF